MAIAFTNLLVEKGTCKLELRPIETHDALPLFKVVDDNREHLAQWLAWPKFVQTSADQEAFVTRCLKEAKEGRSLVCALLVDGNIIGTCGFNFFDTVRRVGYIGYWQAACHQGRGFMTEAVRHLCNAGISGGLDHVEISAAEGNARSLAIPERLDFVKQKSVLDCDADGRRMVCFTKSSSTAESKASQARVNYAVRDMNSLFLGSAPVMSKMVSGYSYGRIIVGGWQLSSGHHASFERRSAIDSVVTHLRAGLSTFDMGDIYTGVESLCGEALASVESSDREQAKAHTKLVPDLDVLAHVDRSYVRGVLRRSLNRLGLPRLHMVQFHWWDWSVGSHVDAYRHLVEAQRDGLVGEVGLTNYDGVHLKELLDAGLPVAGIQVQYSLLDDRAAFDLAPLCHEHGISLLCYGALAGGFLTDKWLDAPEPSCGAEENRSLTKYHLIIQEFGGWALFQELLAVLKVVAKRRSVSIALVAVAWVLQQPAVGAAILGARSSKHIPLTHQASRLLLSTDDLQDIHRVRSRRQGPSGPFYGLERNRDGPHGRIMRYNLNQLYGEAHLVELEARVAQFCSSAKSGADMSDHSKGRLAALQQELQGFTRGEGFAGRLEALHAQLDACTNEGSKKRKSGPEDMSEMSCVAKKLASCQA